MNFEQAYNALVNAIKRNVAIPVIVGEVTTVNSNFTCDITPVDGGPVYHDIRLKASVDADEKGLIIIPSVGASVILVRIGHDENNAYVLAASKIDRYFIKTESGITLELTSSGELHLNGNAFKGVLKHDDVKHALDTLQQSVNLIVGAGQAAFQALSVLDGGASASAFNAGISARQPIVTNNLQNPKVKHG